MTRSQSLTSVAATAGIVGSAWIAGGNMTISTLTIPALLSVRGEATPRAIVRQWHAIYDHARTSMPAVMLPTLLGFGYMAYERGIRGLEWRGFAAAAALSASILPFTLVFIMPTNVLLIAIARGKENDMSDDNAWALLARWKRLNLARSFLSLAAAVVGSWSYLG